MLVSSVRSTTVRAAQAYLFSFKLGVQKALVYRTNFVFRALFGLLPLFAIISLWKTIYQGPEQEIAGYTIVQMVSYYLLVAIIDSLTAVTEDDWQIASDIKDGHISQFLLRPVEYLSYRLSLFTAGRCVFTLAAAGPLVLFLWWNRAYFVYPPDWATGVGFMASVVLSALLQFLLSFILAMLAFWVYEISAFAFVLLAFQRLLGGQMFPLDLLPAWLQFGLFCTPMPYTTFFPASIYLGRVQPAELMSGLVSQAGWVVLAWCLAGLVWRRGLRRYTAAGA